MSRSLGTPGGRGARRLRGAWARGAGVAAISIGPLLVALILTRGSGGALSELSPAWKPTYFTIATVSLEVSTEGNLTATVEPTGTVTSHALAGVTTAVWVGTGDHVASGTRIIDVDGVGVLAYEPAQGAVFFRDLCPGDSGADVTLLQRLLTTQGWYAGPLDGEFGPRTRASVMRLDSAMGVAEPSGCFTLARVALVPAGGLVVGEVEVSLGSVVGADGTTLLTGEPRVLDVTLETPDFLGPDGAYLADLGRVTLSVTRSEGSWEIDPAVAESALAGQGSADGRIDTTVRVKSVAPVSLQVLPTTAAFIASGGQLCMGLEPTTLGGAIEFFAIQPVAATRIDGVGVTPEAQWEGRNVLANPPPSYSERECR